MTTNASPVRVLQGADQLEVKCTSCGLHLAQIADFDRDVALGTFLQHHPMSPEAVHLPDIPPGWCEQPTGT